MQIFFTSPWVPAEWIRAHELQPRGVWFAPDWESPSPAAGTCAFADAALHLAERSVDSATIFTTHCDQLRRGFDAASSTEANRTFLLNLPATTGPVAPVLFLAELERLHRFLLRLGGQPPTRSRLEQEMREYTLRRTQLLEAARACPPRAYAEALARFHWDGSVHLPEPPPATGPQTERVPLALLGSPLARKHWEVLDRIEAVGGTIVLNATEAGERSLWTSDLGPALAGATPKPELSTEPDWRPALAALAQAYCDHCVDAYQRPNTRLYNWLQSRLSERGVRGIILWHFVGCDLWRAEAASLREAFGLPLLLLEADETAACPPRSVGRLQAFVESLR